MITAGSICKTCSKSTTKTKQKYEFFFPVFNIVRLSKIKLAHCYTKEPSLLSLGLHGEETINSDAIFLSFPVKFNLSK